MTNCRPDTAFSPSLQKGHWRAIEYNTAEHQGKLIYAGSETKAPELSLHLGLKGWYAIYVGLWGRGNQQPCAVKLKLTGEVSFRVIEKEISSVEHLEEAFFKHTDLTDRELIIAQSRLTPANEAGIAYVRCEPLPLAVVRQIKQDRSQNKTKRIISYNDGEGLWARMPTSKQEIWEFIEPLADSDYAELYWGITGERVGYPSKVARTYGSGVGHFHDASHRRQKECMDILICKGIHPLTTAMEYAHSIGLKFHLYQRMGAFAALPPFDETLNSDIYNEHPEFRCKTADGRTVMRLSLAYPEVRAYMLAILREAAEFGVDGLNLNFKRGALFVFYDPPLVKDFTKQTGQDPRQLDEWDEQWLRFLSGPVTTFVREVRQMLCEVGDKLGKRMQLSATTHPTPEECLFFGLDLKTWIQEGLVDNLTPMGFSHGGKEVDFGFYTGLVEGTQCRFCPHLPVNKEIRDGAYYDCEIRASGVREWALRYFQNGADGLCLWDSGGVDTKTSLGPMARRLGHVDELKAAMESKISDDGPKLIPLRSIGGCDLTVRIPTDVHRLYPRGTVHHAWAGL